MKCITYISKVIAKRSGATVPTGLSEIYQHSRKANRGFNITGVLSYRNGFYIQVIEGDDRYVDQLFHNICRDDRHAEVEKILDIPIRIRSFTNWDMKLVKSVDKDPRFESFIERHRLAIEACEADKVALLNQFYSISKINQGDLRKFDNKRIGLRAWPDFNLIEQTPEAIALCAQLVARSWPFSEVLAASAFQNQDELELTLTKLDSLGVLQIESIDVPKSDTQLPSTEPNSFYSRMKMFLNLGV